MSETATCLCNKCAKNAFGDVNKTPKTRQRHIRKYGSSRKHSAEDLEEQPNSLSSSKGRTRTKNDLADTTNVAYMRINFAGQDTPSSYSLDAKSKGLRQSGSRGGSARVASLALQKDSPVNALKVTVTVDANNRAKDVTPTATQSADSGDPGNIDASEPSSSQDGTSSHVSTPPDENKPDALTLALSLHSWYHMF